jgi:hypothetical protein
MGESVAAKIKRELELYGLLGEPLGVDVNEMPVLAALQAAGITVVDGQQVFIEARRTRTCSPTASYAREIRHSSTYCIASTGIDRATTGH